MAKQLIFEQMSWDVVIFNTKEPIKSIDEVNEDILVPIDFCKILEDSFNRIVKDEEHRAIEGNEFVIDYFIDEEPVSNKMFSLYSENGLYELIELAKKHHWQIFDTGLGEFIDLENPENNGYENHRKYVEQIMKRK